MLQPALNIDELTAFLERWAGGPRRRCSHARYSARQLILWFRGGMVGPLETRPFFFHPLKKLMGGTFRFRRKKGL